MKIQIIFRMALAIFLSVLAFNFIFGFFQNFRGVAAGLVPALGDHKGSPLHIGLCTENPKEPFYFWRRL